MYVAFIRTDNVSFMDRIILYKAFIKLQYTFWDWSKNGKLPVMMAASPQLSLKKLPRSESVFGQASLEILALRSAVLCKEGLG
jgi:hypothetical protein